MNDYISINTKKYPTSANAWEPQIQKPSTFRLLLNGNTDTTYGAAKMAIWEGEIVVKVGEARSGYGTPSDLETALNTLGNITFIDHYGTTYSVVVQSWRRKSLGPKWDGSTNRLHYIVTLKGKAS